MGRLTAGVAVLLLTATTGLLIGQEAPPPRQDPPKTPIGPEAAPPQDDKAPITNIVETWMRFVQEGEHRGFVHEKISPMPGRSYKYEYLYEGDLDLSVPSEAAGEVQIIHWSWQLSAQLTENFDPYRLEATSNLGGAQWRLDIRTVEDKRVLELTLPQTADNPQGEIIRQEIPSDQEVGTTGELLFYKLRHKGDLAKPGDVQYRLLGAAGGTEANLKIKVDAPILKSYMKDGKPSYVTPVTVEGAPADSSLPIHFKVYVDKHGRIVEAVGREESMHYVICATATEARGGEFALSARGRRDPFSKLGAMTPKGITKGSAAKGGQGAEAALVIPPERVGEELQKAGKMIDDLEQAVRGNSPRAEQIYQRFLRQYEALRKLCAGDPVKLNQLDGYKAKAEQVYGGAERLVKRARALLEGIEDFYNALNDKGVEENLKQIKELRSKREFFQDERVVEMDRIIRTAEQKLAQTKARIELRSKVLVLTGTVAEAKVLKETVSVNIISGGGGRLDLDEPVKLVHNLTFAVVNDKLYREGEEVEGQGVVIEKIQPHGVRVSYKGEVREVGLKKTGQ